jgi:hypothetical protein
MPEIAPGPLGFLAPVAMPPDPPALLLPKPVLADSVGNGRDLRLVRIVGSLMGLAFWLGLVGLWWLRRRWCAGRPEGTQPRPKPE